MTAVSVYERRGGRCDAGEGATAAAVRPLHDVVGHGRHVGPGELHLAGPDVALTVAPEAGQA